MIKVNNQICNFKRYNDGSLRAQIIVPNSPVDILWLYDNPEELLFLYYLTAHLRDNRAEKINLRVPYLIDARADKIKTESEIFTLKYSCQLLNSMNFNSIEVFDIHSFVSTALLNRIHVENPSKEIKTLLSAMPKALLFYPDEGSYKRSRMYFDVPAAFAVKQRNYETQKIESLRLGGCKHNIAGSDILIIDDILSRGSTLYESASLLKEMGANSIFVFVSHCESTVVQKNLNGRSLLEIPNLIEKIYTTNSIWRNISHPKIEVIKYFN